VIPDDGAVSERAMVEFDGHQDVASFDIIIGEKYDREFPISSYSSYSSKEAAGLTAEDKNSDNQQWARWPRELWGLKLGRIAQTIRNDDKEQYYKEIKLSLIRIGFPFGLQKRVTSFADIFIALQCYRRHYGDLWVPYRYSIPQDDERFPLSLRGLPLGVVVRSIRHNSNFSNHRKELELINFPFGSKKQAEFQIIKSAVQIYQNVHGINHKIPRSYVIPVDKNFEKPMWGMKLGMICWRIEHGYDWQKFLDEYMQLFTPLPLTVVKKEDMLPNK